MIRPGSGEETNRLTDRHLKHFVNVLSLVEHFQDATAVTHALTFFADQFNIGEKLHLDRDGTVPLACLAASAWYVEGKASRCITARSGSLGRREKIANLVEPL